MSTLTIGINAFQWKTKNIKKNQKKMADVCDYRKLDLNSLVYTVPEKREKRHVSDIYYQKLGQPVYIQTPKLICKKVKDNGSKSYMELEVSSESFYEFLRSLDDVNQDVVYNKAEKWFKGKTFSYDFVEEAYKSPIIPPKHVNELSKVRLSLSQDNVFYNQHKEQLSLSDVSYLLDEEEKLKVISIIQIKGIWITSNSIGVIYEVVQTKVYQKKQKTVVPYVLADSDEEVEVHQEVEQVEKVEVEKVEEVEVEKAEKVEEQVEKVEEQEVEKVDKVEEKVEVSEHEEKVEEPVVIKKEDVEEVKENVENTDIKVVKVEN